MIRNSIPNMFTVGNLFLGIVAIILAFTEQPELAAIMVIVAMLLDGLDGRVARALNAQSEFGKELDSLSDVISFGVAPAFIMYVVAFQDLASAPTAWIVTAIFPICGALRLARFNVVEGIPGYFIGLPIPAAGGILCTLALFEAQINSAVLLILSTLLLSYLMISTVKYPSFKKIGLSRKALWVLPILLVVCILLAVKYPGPLSRLIFVPLLLYALWGLKKNVDVLIVYLFRRNRRKREERMNRQA